MKATDIEKKINQIQADYDLSLMHMDFLVLCKMLNDRMTEIDCGQARTANIASCLANGVQPD